MPRAAQTTPASLHAAQARDGRLRTLVPTLAACVLALSVPSIVAAGPPGVSEPAVKAAMLYNFVKFVDWPAVPPSAAKAAFVIGVQGSSSFPTVLARTVAEHTVRGRPISVRHVQSVADLSGCHVLFISGQDTDRAASAIEPLKRSPVLTIGEAPGFARRGGIIGFVIVDNRTNFEINVDASARARLKISSKLLRLATVVKGQE